MLQIDVLLMVVFVVIWLILFGINVTITSNNIVRKLYYLGNALLILISIIGSLVYDSGFGQTLANPETFLIFVFGSFILIFNLIWLLATFVAKAFANEELI